MTSARLRRTVLAGAVAVATLLLTACGTNLAGSASVVGAQTVSDSEVATSVDEVRSMLAGVEGSTFDQATATKSVLERKTRHLLLAEAARRESVTVPQAQVDDIIASTVESQFGGKRGDFDVALAGQQNVPASEVDDYARDYLIQQALLTKVGTGSDEAAQQASVTAYLSTLSAELGIEVAARFGTWNDEVVGLGPVPDDLSVTPSSLVVPTASPTPSS